jgi:hypothetical protein
MADRPIKLRIQLDFSPEAGDELTVLGTRLQAQSNIEIMHFALRSLQWLTETIQSGNKILVDDNKGGVEEAIFPFIPPKKPSTH